MNFLAHAYLSFNDPSVLAGNMISDFVKGKTQYEYPAPIQTGIKLHRFIDEFTDTHRVTTRMKEFFRPQYRLYAGAFADVVYDHFLACDEQRFHEYGGLLPFTLSIYRQLEKYRAYFPARFAGMFPYMKSQNWLVNYAEKQGIQQSFKGLVHRAEYLSESDVAFALFKEHYQDLKKGYEEFFPELYLFSRERFLEMKR